jgi:hypothetical protein
VSDEVMDDMNELTSKIAQARRSDSGVR